MKNFENDIRDYYEKEYGEDYHIFYACSWEEIPFSFQWGVYVDFFDANGILIEDLSNWDGEEKYFDWCIRTDKLYESEMDWYNRQEARKAALEKAIEIYNSLDQ